MRHCQYQEFEVRKRTEAKKATDTSSSYFLGRTRQTGGALVDPELQKWVAERASRDSAVLKEQRKAAEERALQAEKKGKK